MNQDTATTILSILQTMSGITDISETDSLQETLGLDSLHMVTLLLELEDTFDICLQESDLNPFDLVSVEDVIHLIKRYREDI